MQEPTFTLMEATNKDVIRGCFRDKSGDLVPGNPLGIERTTQAALNSGTYITNLFAGNYAGNNNNATLHEKCDGKLGNKYLIEYGECKFGNETKKTYKIVDNTCESGLIQCMFSSVGKTGSSTANLFKNIFNVSIPDCSSSSLKEYKTTDEEQDKLELHVKKNDKMKTGKLNANVYVVENFENLYNNVIQHLEENNYNEFNELNELYKKNLINNDFISETYYVLLIIFLLFLIYKIGNKK
jgi:hypothetical protein